MGSIPSQQDPSKNGRGRLRKWWRESADPWLTQREYGILLGTIGLVVGFAVAVGPDLKAAAAGQLSKEEWLFICTLAGAAAGFGVYGLYRWVKRHVLGLRIEEIEAPLVGGKIKIKVTDDNRAVAWKIFVESTTRITTQRLSDKEGLLRVALDSMYKFFTLVRDELKNVKPSPPPPDPASKPHTLEGYAVLMLNDALRPMLARWHPRLTFWEKTGLPESLWPLAEACRKDIETTRKSLRAYTWELGGLLKVGWLKEMLGDEPREMNSRLTAEDANVSETLARLDSTFHNPQWLQMWHVFTEAATRVAARPLAEGEGMLREELAALDELFDSLRSELKAAIPAPPPKATAGGAAQPSLASYAGRLLNEVLRPMLDRWNPRLAAWEKAGRLESQWPLAELCRRDLEATRKGTLLVLWEFSELLKVPYLQSLLHARPTAAEGALTPAAEIANLEATMWNPAAEPSKAAGWRIFVELVSCVAVSPPREKAGEVREAVASLHELYGSIRAELKGVTPAGPPGAQAADTVEAVALEILGGPLRGFLAEWFPAMHRLDEQIKDAPAAQSSPHSESGPAWPQAGACAAALKEVRADLVNKSRRLAIVLRVPPDRFFDGPGGTAPPQALEEQPRRIPPSA